MGMWEYKGPPLLLLEKKHLSLDLPQSGPMLYRVDIPKQSQSHQDLASSQIWQGVSVYSSLNSSGVSEFCHKKLYTSSDQFCSTFRTVY